MADWKSKLADRLPSFTRKQVFYLIALVGGLLIVGATIIYVPTSVTWGTFGCDKGSMKVIKK